VHFVREQNRRAWDERVRRQAPHTESASRQELENPFTIIDDCGWLGGNVRGKRVLCLAAGGGKHSALFAAAGAIVTVVDLSPAMLERDRRRAAELGFTIRAIEASMDDLSPLTEDQFEVVIQPVSTCYVPELMAVYREVARVTMAGGIYISQHKQPAMLQAGLVPGPQGYTVSEPYYRSGPLPPVLTECQHREVGTVEYLHRLQELIGGMCRSGFVIEDLVEPRHGQLTAEPGTFAHRSQYLPPFLTLKARRVGTGSTAGSAAKLWTP
jgi:ubiquinone/menaquinone biosynthesis C-methylase UbiE